MKNDIRPADSTNRARSSPPAAPRRESLPGGLFVLVWYLGIKSAVSGYPEVVANFVPAVWWQSLVSRCLLTLSIAVVIARFMKREGLSDSELGYRSRWRMRDVGLGVVAGAAIWLIHDELLNIAARWSGAGWVNTGVRYDSAAFRHPGPADVIGFAYAAAIVTPILEEIVYRGCLLVSFAKRWGSGYVRETAYVSASSILFAFAHELSHPMFTVVYVVTGACFAVFYLRARSLNAVIVAHAVVNGIFIFRGFR